MRPAVRDTGQRSVKTPGDKDSCPNPWELFILEIGQGGDRSLRRRETKIQIY